MLKVIDLSPVTSIRKSLNSKNPADEEVPKPKQETNDADDVVEVDYTPGGDYEVPLRAENTSSSSSAARRRRHQSDGGRTRDWSGDSTISTEAAESLHSF